MHGSSREGNRLSNLEGVKDNACAERVHRHLSVQPDLQLVLNPAGEREREPLLVGGSRLTVGL